MKNPVPNAQRAVDAIGAHMIPATEHAMAAAEQAARTLAELFHHQVALRQSRIGRKLPLDFAHKQINIARAALDAACRARELMIETRLTAIELNPTLFGEAFGPQCLCIGADEETNVTELRVA